MAFLADSWVLWLVVAALLIGGLVFYRQNRRTVGSLYTSADDFAVHTILFNTTKGEGDVFIGYVLAIVSFSMALAGLVRWVRTIL